MKFLTFIIAFLVLTLSCLPCADKDVVMKAGKANTELTKNTTGAHNDHEDSCSPFCHCACCSSYIVDQRIPSFTFRTFYSSGYFESLNDDDLIERSLPVWQPPQLV
jgi:hypothetical protein